MKTITLEEPGRFSLTETPAPTEGLGVDEALVRVRKVGICGTDLHAFRGKQPFFTYPRILGHELGVEIVQAASNSRGLKPGDLCAVEPYLNCGRCVACRRGKTNCCTTLKVLGVHIDGGMREFIKVPLSKLHKSATLSLDQLALIETLGIGAHAVDRARLEAGETVLVVGAGPIGLSVIQFAQLAQVKLIVLDINEQRLDFCKRHLKVEHTILAQNNSLQQLQELSSGELATAVFDATGNSGSMHESFRYLANGGRLVFVGLFQGDVTFNDPDFHRRELSILATRNSTSADFGRIVKYVESGVIDTNPWITHRASCVEMPAEFAGWLEPRAGVIKAVVEFPVS